MISKYYFCCQADRLLWTLEPLHFSATCIETVQFVISFLAPLMLYSTVIRVKKALLVPPLIIGAISIRYRFSIFFLCDSRDFHSNNSLYRHHCANRWWFDWNRNAENTKKKPFSTHIEISNQNIAFDMCAKVTRKFAAFENCDTHQWVNLGGRGKRLTDP